MKRIICWFLMHKWTCAAEQGIKPTKQQLTSVEGFWEYSTMYCKRCGKVSELSKLKSITNE